ncbi:MAG: radical SAM protein [Candidatus Omnitrophica bacterium]|nr:radical SAM protein [Candidatus Omnitrophota bacterium]MBU1870111.1 radical SAM protein [Candidatus Omnitrophota bacterium]
MSKLSYGFNTLRKKYSRWLVYMFKSRSDIMGLRLTTTWKCNSKCVTCSIWKIPEAGINDLSVEEIDRFSRSRYFRNTEYVTFSGGEPTLRADLPEIVSVLHKNLPKARFQITTNGLNPQLEENLFRKIVKDNPGINFSLVGISLNGPPEIHDFTRGMPGSWQKAVETYERLKNIVHCEFSFTFCRHNADYFEWVCNFAREKGTRAYICWTVMNSRFNVEDEDLVFWKPAMVEIFRKYVESIPPNPQTIFDKIRGLLGLDSKTTHDCLYDNIIHRRLMPCYAGSQIVHVAPNGDVYPCNFKLTDDRIMGNLRKNDFDTIWESFSKKVAGEIARGECMYPNGLCGDSEIYPSICNNPPFVLWWFLRRILRIERPGK